MKKILIILLLQMAIAFNVFAQGEGDRIVNPTWKLSSGALTPTVSTWTLTLPATTFSSNILLPASAYINYGATAGTSGYGIYDNGGTLQFKNSGGSWANIGTGSGGWSDGGVLLYPTTSTDSPILANKAALLSTITSDYSGLYFYDDASNVKVMALLDDAGTETTTQVATANMWGEPVEGYIFDETDDMVSMSDVDFPSGANDRTVIITFRPDAATSGMSLFSYGTWSSNNAFRITVDNTVNVVGHTNNYNGTATITIGKVYMVAVVLSSGNLTTYVNNIIDQNSVATTLSTTLSGTAYIGRGLAAANYFKGHIYSIKVYNNALTQAEVTALYHNGQSGKAEIQYKYKWGSQTMVATYDSSGVDDLAITLTTRKDYYWTKGSADSISVGTTKYTASTKISYISGTVRAKGDLTGSTLKQVGAVASYKGLNAGATGWIDESDNRLHGNTSGNPIALSGHRDVKDGATAAIVFTASAKKGTILKYVKIVNNVADADSVTMGTAALGTEVFTQQIIGSLGTAIVVVNKFFSDTAAQTLYLDSANWTGDNLDVILYYEPFSKEL